MKFVNTNKLNVLCDAFEKCSRNSEDFQSFIERARQNGEAACFDTEEIKGFLEKLHDEDYDYLLECDEDDLEFHGQGYLKRINFFRRLLGAEELTLKDIKQDRQDTDCLLKGYEVSDEKAYEWAHARESQPHCQSGSNTCKEVYEKMDADTKKRLDSYLELLDEISEKTDDAVTAVAILHEISKDRRAEQIRGERAAQNGDAATTRQKRFMRKLGIDYPEEISRKGASMLIQEELDKLNGTGE
jgi:hypothetical protein